MATGYVKLRRGLLEHLPRMTPTTVKVYLFFMLKAKGIGVDQGVYRATTREMAEELGMNRIAIMRAIKELEAMEPKPFIAVKRSTNQHLVSEYRILRFAGSESRPPSDSAGIESEPSPIPAAIPADQPKQPHINGLASPKTEETEENTDGTNFRRGSDGSYPTWFERLWGMYPSSKGSKQAGLKWALKVIKSESDIELALRYLSIRAEHISRMKAKGAFVENLPHLERYVSKGLWNQEPEVPAETNNTIEMAWGQRQAI